MRTTALVQSEPVVSIALAELHERGALRHSVLKIQRAISRLKWGKSDTKDFLKRGSATLSISRRTGERKRAANIYLSKLEDDIREALLQGSRI